MPRYFPDDFLRRLRNEISWPSLLRQLEWPHKRREGQLAFVCPICNEYRSAVNPRTNLGHCFLPHCKARFNPIEFVMAVTTWDFVTAVHYLQPLLPPGAQRPASD